VSVSRLTATTSAWRTTAQYPASGPPAVIAFTGGGCHETGRSARSTW